MLLAWRRLGGSGRIKQGYALQSLNNKVRSGANSCNRLLSTTSSIVEECLRLRAGIQGLNDRVKGPLEKSSQKNTVLPFVFLLGNHSSGKSSFVNYVCERKIQTSGVAPTDDTFTVIVPGPADVDRDGPAMIGDPDLGFGGLRSFGPQLIHHTQLKVRSGINPDVQFMIVDTPGMIDSPMVRTTSGEIKHAVMDRGYDFEKVCRWYAERADVILLFFDPDKPGTTGETLQVLTNSLVGLDHKLHIILNKADQFRKIHDFARAYGSLCWNLSKVIPRKDLPRIYTMCLPSQFQTRASGDQSEDIQSSSLGQAGLIDLEATRNEVVSEVLNAPKRRVDNEISRLSDSVYILQMHCKIMADLSKRYRRALLKSRLMVAGGCVATVGFPGAAFYFSLPMEFVGLSGGLPLLATLGLAWWQSKIVQSEARRLTTPDELERTYQSLYARRISEKDEFTVSLWNRVSQHLNLVLPTTAFNTIDSINANDLAMLETLIEKDIPNLRRSNAPSHLGGGADVSKNQGILKFLNKGNGETNT